MLAPDAHHAVAEYGAHQIPVACDVGRPVLHIELRWDAGVVSIRSGACPRAARRASVAEEDRFNIQCQRTLTRLTLFGAALLFVFALPQTSRAQSKDRVGVVERLQGDVS